MYNFGQNICNILTQKISTQLHPAPHLRSCYPPNTFSICSYYILPSSFFHSFLGVHQQRNFQHNSQTFKPGVATQHYTPQYNGLKLILKETFFIHFFIWNKVWKWGPDGLGVRLRTLNSREHGSNPNAGSIYSFNRDQILLIWVFSKIQIVP